MKATKITRQMAILILVGMFLAACSKTQVVETPAANEDAAISQLEVPNLQDEMQETVQGALVKNNSPAEQAGTSSHYWVEELPRVDEQGAVVIEIIPLKLNNPGSSLIFDVRMNTHSVDLSMDLAKLAVLSTDTGKTVQAIDWSAPAGGHHVSGKLSFPSSVDGWPLLEGVQTLTLTLSDVDAPERVFVWEK